MRSTSTKVGGYIGVEVAITTPGYTKWHVYIQRKCSVSIINCRRDKSRKSIFTWSGLNLRQLINCSSPSTVQRCMLLGLLQQYKPSSYASCIPFVVQVNFAFEKCHRRSISIKHPYG